jgi:hypothetical protein
MSEDFSIHYKDIEFKSNSMRVWYEKSENYFDDSRLQKIGKFVKASPEVFAKFLYHYVDWHLQTDILLIIAPTEPDFITIKEKIENVFYGKCNEYGQLDGAKVAFFLPKKPKDVKLVLDSRKAGNKLTVSLRRDVAMFVEQIEHSHPKVELTP